MRSNERVRGLTRAMALPLLLLAGSVHAANCTVSTPGIAFGGYDPVTGAVVNGMSTVRVNCTNLDFIETFVGVGVTVAADGGGSGNQLIRRMSGPPGSQMFYNLYVSPPPSGAIWGNGTGGTQQLGGTVGGLFTGQPNPRTFPVHGQINAGQSDLVVGSYSDQVTVTITF